MITRWNNNINRIDPKCEELFLQLYPIERSTPPAVLNNQQAGSQSHVTFFRQRGPIFVLFSLPTFLQRSPTFVYLAEI